MENSNDIKISIPKPCHENWNEMTPNEKGAFCGKCAKTVVDFTKKTTEEIKDFLTAQTGKKVCGRFMNDQLDTPVQRAIELLIPMNLLPKKLSFSKIFAFSIFISFGTSLFSCSTQMGEVVGKIAPVVDTSASIRQGEVMETRSIGDTTYTVPVKKQVPVKKECTTKGDVAIEATVGELSPVIDTSHIVIDTLKEESFTTGKIKMPDKK